MKYLSIAQAISIFFVEPLILTLLSALFLGEVIRMRRILAIVIGFAGALIIIRPTFFDVGLPALYPLGTALSFALYLMVTRKLSSQVHPFQMQWMVGLSATISLSLLLALGSFVHMPVFIPSLPSGINILWVLGLGIVATIGHLTLVHALKRPLLLYLPLFNMLKLSGQPYLGILSLVMG